MSRQNVTRSILVICRCFPFRWAIGNKWDVALNLRFHVFLLPVSAARVILSGFCLLTGGLGNIALLMSEIRPLLISNPLCWYHAFPIGKESQKSTDSSFPIAIIENFGIYRFFDYSWALDRSESRLETIGFWDLIPIGNPDSLTRL